MIASLEPYPAMKDSGVPWLGEVPEHWDVKRAKTIFQCVDVRSSTGEEELLTVSSDRGVVPRSSATVTMFKAESYVGYKLCWPDDLVINSLWAWGRGLGVSRHHGIVSSAYGVYRLRPQYADYARYIHELVRSTPFNWELQVRSKGIWISRLQLTDEAFLGAPFPLPPIQEQAAIVRFLDHGDRRIRRYIRAKQKLIKLLEEQKQAIIHRAVTRGLDPNVRLKPSGVDWLGDVPEHWTVASLRFRYDQCLGKMVDAKKATNTRLLPYLRNVDVQWDRINTDELPLIDIGEAEQERFTVSSGDLLVCEGRHLGRAAIWRSELPVCAFQKALHRLRARDERSDVPRYLYYCLYVVHYLDAFGASSSDNSIPHLTGEMLRAFRFAFPPLAEQEAIATYLDVSCSQLDQVRSIAEREVGAMREYRTRLIADVVTGKLDVREAAARLPQEAEDLEPVDETGVESEAQDADAGDADAEDVPEEAEA